MTDNRNSPMKRKADTEEQVDSELRRLRRELSQPPGNVNVTQDAEDGVLCKLATEIWPADEEIEDQGESKEDEEENADDKLVADEDHEKKEENGEEQPDPDARRAYPYLVEAMERQREAFGLPRVLTRDGLKNLDPSIAQALNEKWKKYAEEEMTLKAELYKIRSEVLEMFAEALKALIAVNKTLIRMGFGEVWRSVKPYLAMVFLQFGYGGMFIVSVASLKRGMSHYVLVVYRNAVAAAVIGPFALWFEGKVRPKMTLLIFLKIMTLALLEPVLDQNFYYMGAKYTSASFSSALYNILPAVTFVIAIVLRMEKINIKTRHSQAKVIGTLVTVIGALIMILYKGPIVDFIWSKGRSHHTESAANNDSHWLIGIFMLLFSCCCWSLFFILQSNTLKSYPAELSLSALICVMGTALAGAVALVMERGAKPWIISFDTRLFTAVYSGVICSGVAYYLQGVVMKERGPVFVTAFNPLCMIIVAVMGSIILGEEISLGRVIGAVIIVIGLYSLIWGKSKDHLAQSTDVSEEKGALELPKAANDAMLSNSVESITIVEISSAKTT
ncbi:WAT1-related protein [Canna indica]|uniref:WAT1-related protein n=1 Tax=Canna indica TaxID=4628 RepID=A0AAQ3QBB1_9LILI|nr:WAT1-related protein [Canna indica]